MNFFPKDWTLRIDSCKSILPRMIRFKWVKSFKTKKIFGEIKNKKIIIIKSVFQKKIKSKTIEIQTIEITMIENTERKILRKWSISEKLCRSTEQLEWS